MARPEAYAARRRLFSVNRSAPLGGQCSGRLLVLHLRGWAQRRTVRRTAAEDDALPQEASSFGPRQPAGPQDSMREEVCGLHRGRLTLHFLPGYAPDLNPDELVWSHVKRTGVARWPLRQGEKLRERIEEQLAKLQQLPRRVRSFFQAPSVGYISSC